MGVWTHSMPMWKCPHSLGNSKAMISLFSFPPLMLRKQKRRKMASGSLRHSFITVSLQWPLSTKLDTLWSGSTTKFETIVKHLQISSVISNLYKTPTTASLKRVLHWYSTYISSHCSGKLSHQVCSASSAYSWAHILIPPPQITFWVMSCRAEVMIMYWMCVRHWGVMDAMRSVCGGLKKQTLSVVNRERD